MMTRKTDSAFTVLTITIGGSRKATQLQHFTTLETHECTGRIHRMDSQITAAVFEARVE